jgi:hypothetical protein
MAVSASDARALMRPAGETVKLVRSFGTGQGGALMIPLTRLVLPLSLLCLAVACDGPRPPSPPAKQPSVLDRAVEPALGPLGVKVAPQGGFLLPTKPSP